MTGKELVSYYRAAVEFIDPKLSEDCPVEDICAAARARQLALDAHDSETARLEHEKIGEALDFIQRIHPDVCTQCSQPESVDEAVSPDVEPAQLQQAVAAGQLQEPAADQAGAIEAVQESEEELVELVIGRPREPEVAMLAELEEELPTPEAAQVDVAQLPEADAGDLETSQDPAEVPDEDEEQPAAELAIETAVPEEDVEVADETVAGADDAEASPEQATEGTDNEAVADSLAAAMATDRQPQAEPLSRHQFIEQLQARRTRGPELESSEARELINELNGGEDGSAARLQRITEKLPDMQQTLDNELQREEAKSRPLDFRSMMEQAGGSELPAVRPAGQRRLRTDEILSRERPVQRIPEESAAPVLLGILLILWQFSTALLAGFALCRVLVWQIGTPFSSMPPLKAMLACLVGIGSAALIGVWFRIYRMRSRKLSLPVHVTAVSMLALMLAWQLKTTANSYAVPPPLWMWCVLFALWLVATIASGLHDLRVPPATSAEKSEILPGKPAEPLAH